MAGAGAREAEWAGALSLHFLLLVSVWGDPFPALTDGGNGVPRLGAGRVEWAGAGLLLFLTLLVPGWMPRAGLLLLPLLCFGPETTGSIDQAALRDIVDYVNQPLTLGECQYAFVVSLSREKCNQPTNLQEQLPEEALNDMNQALVKTGGRYVPNNWPIVAARPRRQGAHWQHSEWRLLHGGQNSMVAQLKARTCRPNCCLILFTLNSPCMSMCLAENGPYNILSMTRDAFSDIDNNYKAFVFQRIFVNDTQPVVIPQDLLDAWHRLCDVPLLRCDNNCCQDCASVDPQNNPCLARQL